MFNWNDLVFFLELARQGRLVPSARRLKVDHTTVSRRISELERDLCVKLFDRCQEGFVLTEQGHRLFGLAERMEGLVALIGESVAGGPARLSGRVRLATMEGIAAFYLASRLRQFRDRFPEIVVELVAERHLVNLTKREADVSISFVPLAGPKLASRKLGEFRLALFGSREYLERKGVPDTIESLRAHDFVDYVEDLVAVPAVHWLLDIIERPNVTFRSTSMAAQQNAVAAGHGLGLMPLFSAKTNPDLIAVLPDQATTLRDLYLTVHQDIEFLGRVRALCRFIAEQIQADEEYLCGLGWRRGLIP